MMSKTSAAITTACVGMAMGTAAYLVGMTKLQRQGQRK